MEREFAERGYMQKVLIIEDHADMRELLIWQFELMGYMPIAAKRGRDGVEKALSEKPKLIIMITLAGTPNAMVVIKLPPKVELLAAPGPSTPRTSPLPKRSLLGELCTA